MRRPLSILLLVAGVLWTTHSFAEGDLLGKVVPKSSGNALTKALCQPGMPKNFLKSIDGFSVSAGYTFKQAFDASCEMTFWRQPKTTAKMTTQGICTPSIAVSTKAQAFNASFSIIYGCGGDPDNYPGYYVSGGIMGFRHSWGVGDRVFDETAAFLGLVKMAKGSDGQSFSEMVYQFKSAQASLERSLKQLQNNPLAKLAATTLPGKYENYKGELSSSDLLSYFMLNQSLFLKQIDGLIPKMESLRANLKMVASLPPGENKTVKQKDLVAQAAVLQEQIQQAMDLLSPYVLPFYTSSHHDGTVMKASAKSSFYYNRPPYVLGQEKYLITELQNNGGLIDHNTLLPIMPPYQKSIYLDKTTGKHVGNLWSVPPKGFFAGEKNYALPVPFVLPQYGGKYYSTDEEKLILSQSPNSRLEKQTFSPKVSEHSMKEFRQATSSYQSSLNHAVQAIEAARGFSFMNDYQASALSQGKTPNLDHKVGSIEKQKWLDGCNTIDIPLDGLFDVASALPAAIGLATASAPAVAAAAKAGSRMPEIGGNVSYGYAVGGRGQITTPPGIRQVLDALNSCGGVQVTQGPLPNDDFVVHGGKLSPMPRLGVRPVAHEPDWTQ